MKVLSWPFWLAVLSGAVVVVTVYSLDWGLAQHAPARLYIAREILSGAVPYRDIVDLNTPGTLLIHALALLVFGIGDGAWRAFDLCYTLAIALAAAGIAASVGWAAALLAGLLTIALHLANGPAGPGDPEYLVVLPLLLAGASVLHGLRGARSGLLFLGGLASGAAIAIKLSAVTLPLLLTPIIIWELRRERRSLSGVLLFLAGVPVVPMAVLGWLAANDALGAYIAMVRDWQTFYDGIPRLSLAWEVIRLSERAWPHAWPFLPALILVLAPLIMCRRDIPARPVAVCLAVIATGVVGAVIYPKDLEYYLVPFLAGLLVLASIGFGVLIGAAPKAQRMAAAGLIALLILSGPTIAQHIRHLTAFWPSNPVRVEIMADLERLTRGDARVQVLEDYLAANDAMLQLGRQHTTSFTYDYFLFMFPNSPMTQQMRARFISEFTQAPPAAVVITLFPWWDYESGLRGFARLASWPELEALLARDYTLAAERINLPYQGGSGYRIYVRQSAS